MWMLLVDVQVVDGVDSLVGSCSGQALQYVSAMADDSLVGLDSFHVMAWAITGYVFHSTFTIAPGAARWPGQRWEREEIEERFKYQINLFFKFKIISLN